METWAFLFYLTTMDDQEEFEPDNVADYGGWFDTHPEDLPDDDPPADEAE